MKTAKFMFYLSVLLFFVNFVFFFILVNAGKADKALFQLLMMAVFAVLAYDWNRRCH